MQTVLDVRWFTGKDCIGVVCVQTEYDGIQYFIGRVDGLNEEKDKHYLADWGSRFDKAAGKVLFGITD